MLFLCHSDSAVFSILTILGHLGVTHSSLYSVLNCLNWAGLKDDAVAKLAGVSTAEVKRFTGTANNYGVLGVHARHGNLNWKLPKQAPMPLEDSSKLILTAA